MQTIVSVLLLLIAPSTFSYPVYGTKRYQRASYPSPQQPAAAAYSAYPQFYADEQQQQYNVPDDAYYYQQQQQQQQHHERYPTYYGMPSYIDAYQQPAAAPYYNNGPIYGYPQEESPMDDLHDEIRQEDEYDRQRFPTGQEIWFEPPGHNQDSLARVNAAFLRNLMLYNTQFGRPQIPQQEDESNTRNHYNEYDYEDTPSEWWENQNSQGKKQKQVEETDDEDKDVQELKALVNKHRKEYDSLYTQQDIRHDMPTYNQDYDHDYDEAWINWDSKRSASPKKVQPEMVDAKKPAKPKSSTSQTTTTTAAAEITSTVKPQKFVNGKTKGSGQKEIVLPRPATPVRHPFRSSVLLDTAAVDSSSSSSSSADMLASKRDTQKNTNKPSGAIYDTIKQMFTMEQQLDENSHPQQKRYVSNEESLVQELNGLKRHYSA